MMDVRRSTRGSRAAAIASRGGPRVRSWMVAGVKAWSDRQIRGRPYSAGTEILENINVFEDQEDSQEHLVTSERYGSTSGLLSAGCSWKPEPYRAWAAVRSLAPSLLFSHGIGRVNRLIQGRGTVGINSKKRSRKSAR